MPVVEPADLAALVALHAVPWSCSALWKYLLPATALCTAQPAAAAIDAAALAPAVGEEHAKLMEHYVEMPSTSVASQKVIADKLGINPRDLRPTLSRLANCYLHLDRCKRRLLEKSCSESDCLLLMYVELSRYDETPMVVTRKQSLWDIVQGTLGPHPGDRQVANAGDVESLMAVEAASKLVGRSSTKAKILSTESRFAMVLQLPEDAGGGFFAFVGSSVNWLQLLETCSAPILKQCLMETTSASEFAEDFKFKVRMTTTDQHASNISAEHALIRDRSDSWVLLWLPCNVHIVAGGHSKTFGLAAADISGMVNLTLSLNMGANMNKFRVFLAARAGNIKILRGEVPHDALEYQRYILDKFLPIGSQHSHVEAKRFLLQSVLRGDWRRRDGWIEIYIPIGALLPDEAALRQRVAHAALLSLGGSNWHTYPRSRWVGCEISTDEIGLAMSIGSVFEEAYIDFVRSCGGSPAGSAVARGHAHQQPLLVIRDEVADGDLAGNGGADAPQGGDVPAPAPGAADAASTNDFAVKNARYRATAIEWLRSSPFPRVIILRTCMEPWRKLMQKYIESSSDKWDLQQKAYEASCWSDRGAEPRRLRVLEYAKLTFENSFLEELLQLFGGEAWVHMPIASCDLRHRGFVFRLLSRSGCLVAKFLKKPALDMPVALFLLLEDSSIAAKVQEMPQCLLGEFAKGFLEAFPEQHLSSDGARHCLYLIALCAHTENVALEVWHAILRRFIVSQGVQTWAACIEFLNAQLVCMRLRGRSQTTTKGHVEKTMGSKAAPRPRRRRAKAKAKRQPKVRKDGTVKKTSWGGAMRAFIRLRLRSTGQAADFSALAGAYRALDRGGNEYNKCVALAKAAATVPRQKGRPTFGKKSWRELRDAERVANRALANRGAARLDHQMIEVRAGNVFTDSGAVEKSLALVRQGARHIALCGSARKRKATEHLAQHLKDTHTETDKLLEHMPDLGPLKSSLHRSPDRRLDIFEVDFDITKQGAALAAWAADNPECKLDAALKLDWQHKCREILGSGLPAINTVVHNKGKTDCMAAGRCICSEEGMPLAKFRNSFLRLLKLRCRPKSQARVMLADALLFVRWRWKRDEVAEGSWADMALGGLSSPPPAGQEDAMGEWWFHIGFHSFQPYESVFHRMVVRDHQEEDRRRIWLVAACDFLVDWDLFAMMHRGSTTWTVEFFELDDSSQPQGSVLPREVPVKSCRHCPGKVDQVWPRPRGGGGPRMQRPREEPIVEEPDAMDGDEPVGEDELSAVGSGSYTKVKANSCAPPWVFDAPTFA